MHDDLADDAIKSMVKRLAKWPEPPYIDADWMREEFRQDCARYTSGSSTSP